jgi:hypothetical protein
MLLFGPSDGEPDDIGLMPPDVITLITPGAPSMTLPMANRCDFTRWHQADAIR